MGNEDEKIMKNKTIKQIKCHIGIHYVGGDLTIEIKKHKVEMELVPAGVYVKGEKYQFIVPYPNITHIEVIDAQ